MRAGQKLVLGFGVTLVSIVGTWISASHCIAPTTVVHTVCMETRVLTAVSVSVIIAGALGVYLPNYSAMGREAHKRAQMTKGTASDAEASKRTASMWKGMDQHKKASRDE